MSPSRLSSGTIVDVELDLPRFELREVQHVVDEAEQVLLAALDAAEVVALLLVDRPADFQVEQVDVPGDRVERRAQLVAHRREELGLRLVRPLRFRRALSASLRARRSRS